MDMAVANRSGQQYRHRRIRRIRPRAGAWQEVRERARCSSCDPRWRAGPRIRSGAGSVANAVEALRQHVEQEATDELAGIERHGPVSFVPVAAVVLVSEGHTGL